jgi:hypothetical protein
MDDNALTADEAKYFETGGTTPPPEPKIEEAPVEKVEEAEPEAKAPEPKEAPPEIEVVEDDDGEGEPDARKYVRVGVLRREREKAKAAREQALQANQQMAELRRQIEAAKTPPRELTAEELPHVALERVQKLENELANNAAKSNFINAYQKAANDFAKEQADFPEAYQHALQIRRNVYEDAGYDANQVNALLESEEAAIVERAFLSGENPAAKLYKIAKTLGYQPKAKEAPKKETDATAKVLDSAERLANIAKGMEKNKSVSGGGGADSTPTLTELADMDDAEFEKMTAGDNWKKMMGG